MKDFIFDTETTGKLLFNRPVNDPGQPRVVQIAGILVEDGNVRSSFSFIVEPGIPVSPEAERVHGITKEILESCAVPFRNLVDLLDSIVFSCDNLVAHNLSFDFSVMQIMYHYAQVPFSLWQKPRQICTMKSSTPVLKLPSPFGKYKWPTLEEAYQHFVGSPLQRGNHDALEDSRACLEILKGLRERNVPLVS